MRDYSAAFSTSDVYIGFGNRHQMSISDVYFGFRFVSEARLFGGELGGGIGDGDARVGGFFLPSPLPLPLPLPLTLHFPPESLSRRLNDRFRATASGSLAARAPSARDYGARKASRLRLQSGTVQARFARPLSRIPCTGRAGRPACPLSVAFHSLRSFQRSLRSLGAAARSAATPKTGLGTARFAHLSGFAFVLGTVAALPLRRCAPRRSSPSLRSVFRPRSRPLTLLLGLPRFAWRRAAPPTSNRALGRPLRHDARCAHYAGVLVGPPTPRRLARSSGGFGLDARAPRTNHWRSLRSLVIRRGSPSACGLRAIAYPSASPGFARLRLRASLALGYARLRPASPPAAKRNRLWRKLPPPAAKRNRLRRKLPPPAQTETVSDGRSPRITHVMYI